MNRKKKKKFFNPLFNATKLPFHISIRMQDTLRNTVECNKIIVPYFSIRMQDTLRNMLLLEDAHIGVTLFHKIAESVLLMVMLPMAMALVFKKLVIQYRPLR